MSKKENPEIGSLISGTLIESDLIYAFARELERLDKNKLNEVAPADLDYYLIEEKQVPEGAQVLNDLMNALDELSPPYCYFGANEGDCADFGFWISWETIEEAVKSKELQILDNPPDRLTEGKEFLYYLENNRTLYDSDYNIVWEM